MSGLNEEMFIQIAKSAISSGSFHYRWGGGSDDLLPRFVHTAGLSLKGPGELIMAGLSWYDSDDEPDEIVERIADLLSPELLAHGVVDLGRRGEFRLRRVHRSWVEALLQMTNRLLGVQAVPTVQVLPTEEQMTIDVPDLSMPFSPAREPIWRWLSERWVSPMAGDIPIATDLSVMRGGPVLYVGRWGIDEWEFLPASNVKVSKKSLRFVSTGTMIGSDPSLSICLGLDVGNGLSRDSISSDWQEWTA